MIETLMGLDVADNDGYQAYRDAMLPLLERIGGGFRYDFTIAKTLRSSAGHEINRVFIIYFPNRQARDPSLPTYVRHGARKRIRVGRRQRKRTCWDCEREWKRMVVPLEPGRPSEARQLLRTRR